MLLLLLNVFGDNVFCVIFKSGVLSSFSPLLLLLLLLQTEVLGTGLLLLMRQLLLLLLVVLLVGTHLTGTAVVHAPHSHHRISAHHARLRVVHVSAREKEEENRRKNRLKMMTKDHHPSVHLLGGGVRADNVLHLVGVGIVEGEAAGAQPHPITILRPKAVHHRHDLALQAEHCTLGGRNKTDDDDEKLNHPL